MISLNSIKTQDDLKEYLGDLAARVDGLAATEWAGKYTMAPGRNTGELDSLGSLLKAAAAPRLSGDARHRVLANLDADKAEGVLATIRKADLGSPLYSDAVSGSYMVPVNFLSEVQRTADLESVFKTKVRTVIMNSRTMSVPVESTTLSLVWQGAQSSALSEILPTFDTKTLTAYSVAGWVGMTESLLEDNAVNVGGYFAEVWGQKYGLEIDNVILNGTGTPCTGVFGGLSGINTVQMNAGDTSYQDTDADYLLNMISELSGAQRKGAIFVMAPTVFDVVRGLKDATGRYIVDLTQGTIPTIFGYQCYICDSAPAAAGAATRFVFFGNCKNILLGQRKELEVRLFDQTAYAVEHEEIFFRARARLGISFPLPGALVTLRTAAS